MNPSILKMDAAGTKSSSATRSYSTDGVLMPKRMKSLPPAPSPSRSSSTSGTAAMAAAIFLRNNGGATKNKTAATKKKLTCYCSPPPLALRCPLHQFGSWPFRMLATATSCHSPTAAAGGSGDKSLKKKGVVLPIVTRSIPLPFERYLRWKRQNKKPSRFFYEHQAQIALQASGAAGSD